MKEMKKTVEFFFPKSEGEISILISMNGKIVLTPSIKLITAKLKARLH